MHKLSRLSALLIAGVVISAPALAQKAAITVNGQPVSQAAYDLFLNQQRSRGAPDSAEVRAAVREELIRREILVQEARKKGLDRDPAVLAQLELARQAILGGAFVNQYLSKNPLSEAQLKSDYEIIKAARARSFEYRASHVLVETEEEARAIIGKLERGDKIANLAKQSKDPSSRDNKGDLGWNPPGAYVPPFAEALVKLGKGEFTRSPVKTDFGYHVIFVEDTRPLSTPPYDKVKPELQERANQQRVEELIKELRAKAKVN